jgi:hypothetical protein
MEQTTVFIVSNAIKDSFANCKTTTWISSSRHYTIGWVGITRMRSFYLSMGSTSYYVNKFILTSTQFSKPRRRKKRFKDEAETNKKTIFILILIYNQKLKFKISNIKSKSLMRMVMLMQAFLIGNHLILTFSIYTHGHSELFNSLQDFIQQFLKGNYRFKLFCYVINQTIIV